MKKNIFIMFLLMVIPVLLYPVAEKGVSISKFSMEPVPFNERRDPASDSPYNAFDGDLKTAALYSDFTMEFTRPVVIDQIKIVNGNPVDKNLFKRNNRERDIEITLYTVDVKSEIKTDNKKKKKSKSKIKEEKKESPGKKDAEIKDSKDKSQPEKDVKEKDKTEPEIKKNNTPEKVVNYDKSEIFNEYHQDSVKLYFTASETVMESDKKEVNDVKNKRVEEIKKLDTKTEKKVSPPKEKAVKKKIESRKDVKNKDAKSKTSNKKTSAKDLKKKSGSNKSAPVLQKTTEKKVFNPNKIEIVDSKKDKPVKDGNEKKLPAGKEVKNKKTQKKTYDVIDAIIEREKNRLRAAEKKSVKPEREKGDIGQTEDKRKTEKSNTEIEKSSEIKPVEDVTVEKMTGVVRIENDNQGRVFVYASLKDSSGLQSVNLKGKYTVTKIKFRTRDDEYYTGSEPDRAGISEVALFNNGKSITLNGIESMKKSYFERYSKSLNDSISGETFVMYENNEVILRMTFRKNGLIEFYDRYKCRKKGDPDCTSISMPDMWRVTDGKLFMRYHTLWRVWKYELDSQSDMLSENDEIEPPRWMKIYYKSDTGFTDKYLDLIRSEKGIWVE